MSASVAKKMFRENLELFKDDAEKHNLYKGLLNLASAIDDLANKMRSIEQEVHQIKSRIH
jgi:hypothetical protein